MEFRGLIGMSQTIFVVPSQIGTYFSFDSLNTLLLELCFNVPLLWLYTNPQLVCDITTPPPTHGLSEIEINCVLNTFPNLPSLDTLGRGGSKNLCWGTKFDEGSGNRLKSPAGLGQIPGWEPGLPEADVEAFPAATVINYIYIMILSEYTFIRHTRQGRIQKIVFGGRNSAKGLGTA